MAKPSNDLIYDRTSGDISKKTAKGYFNYLDLNRMEEWTEYLADKLHASGYESGIITRPPQQETPLAIALEYIESTGTQYINTGIIPSTKTRIELDLEITSAEKNAFLFGSRVGSGNTQFDMLMSVGSGSHWRFDAGSVITKIPNTVFLGRHQFAMTVNQCSIDGVVTTNSVTTLSSKLPIYLFTVNNNGTADSSSSNTKLIGKIYSCKIYEDGVLVRDLKPYYDANGIACLWDTISQTFFYNGGAGKFIGDVPFPYPKLYTDWRMTDFPTQPEIDRIRNNVNKLQNCFFSIPTWREIIFNSTMDFNQANALEWDLQQIYDWLNAVVNAYEIRQANTMFMQAGGVFNR